MAKGSIPQVIEELAEPIIRSQGLELVDVEYKKEGKNWFLRLFIDKEGGVNVEDCKTVSRLMEDMIEVEDLIQAHYILEVSSPGLDRPIKKEKDFLRYQGKTIQVSTYSPIDSRKKFKGIIEKYENETLFLKMDDRTVEIPIGNLASARLEIEFKL